MRKITVLEFITLDGVMQAPGASKEDESEGFKYGGWMGPYFEDEVGGREMEKQMKATSALLLGRKTYDIWTGYWPDHTETWPQVNKITKYVVSKTLKKPSWDNTVILRNVKDIQKLKHSDGPDLQLYGSSNLLQTLMEYDLVDEYWLKIFPITLGTGKRLFQNGTRPYAFTLEYSTVSPTGVIFASYKRAGNVKIGSML